MSQQARSLLDQSIIAAGPITQRRFVGFDSNQASVQGQPVAGVAVNPALASGNPITVTMVGTVIVETGAALNPGTRVISDASGRAIPANPVAIAAGATAVTSAAANGAGAITGSDPAEHIAGVVVPGQSSAGAGQFVEILLTQR